MTFVSIEYHLFLFAILFFYYLFPIKYRWLVLLAGNFSFYWVAGKGGRKMFLAMVLLSYLCGIFVEKLRQKSSLRLQRIGLWASLILISIPLLTFKEGNYLIQRYSHRSGWSFIAPLGLSFFTVQIIAYLVDIYHQKITAEKNPLKYALFISFFPQIVQGPIPRYNQLAPQLLEGHRFTSQNITYGLHLILWGFFLKFVIADKAAVLVNTVFDRPDLYKGVYVLVAGSLYSLQLYADFQACTKLAQGAAMLFGIRLTNNFNHPYFSRSIKEFWGRWHISFSSCLKDYVYIPLGGNRKGRLRKYINLLITFLVSGAWHGSGYRFLVWGGLHGIYQILGDFTLPTRKKLYSALGFSAYSPIRHCLQSLSTFFLTTIAWIIFRADSLQKAISMIVSIFTVHNPWVLFNDSIFSLGLSWKEFLILICSLGILFWVSLKQEQGISISQTILKQPLIIRWTIYTLTVIVVAVFGTYGFGFNAQDFIYGGF